MDSSQMLTPAENLDISLAYRLKMNVVLTLAKWLKFWDYPFKKAATDFEEMNTMDVYYWVHKTTNPITKAEKGVNMSNLLMTDSSVVGLPKGFEKSNSVTFAAGGDLLYPQGANYKKDVLFEKVSDLLFDQDISFVNIESPVTRQELKAEVISNKAAPIECCSREQFNILKGHKGKNFTVANTANNHTFDMGVEGMNTTAQAFLKEGMLNVGVNDTPEEYGKGKVLIKDGIKLGFASATFGLNGHKTPPKDKYRIHQSKLLSKLVEPELDLLKQQIDDCKKQECDFIIASLHWGFEFEFFPRKRQVEAARKLVEMGADAIISCHPHVIQPVEYYRTKRDSNRVAVIAYSLGSLTWGYTVPYLVLSLILNLRLSKGAIRGSNFTYIEQAIITPVFRSTFEQNGSMVTSIEKLSDHIHGKSKNHPPEYISEIERYARLVLGEYVLLANNSSINQSNLRREAA